jgi:hypothetical protein
VRVRDLLEGEEDLPIIYDLIRAKVAAGERILIAFASDNGSLTWYKLMALEFDQPTDEVKLSMRKVFMDGKPDDTTTIQIQRPAGRLSRWKLVKKQDHWELRT